MDRRDFLVKVGAATAGTALVGTTSASGAGSGSVADWDWAAVRREFRLDPDLTNLTLFYLASHPRMVRNEIDRVRKRLDANSHDFGQADVARVAGALAQYIGGAADDIALVQNTTTGLGIVYQGLVLRSDQEILVNDQDHFVHQSAAQFAAERAGAQVRLGTLYDGSAQATEEEVLRRLRDAITPKTRAVGVTWVQSSTGVRMPIRALAGVVADANQGRPPADRCLLIVDGVHGLAAVDDDAARLGADVFVAGTHKWLFGPRGTGLIWVRPEVRAQLRPVVPSFDFRSSTSQLGPGGFSAFEHLFAVPAAVEFHHQIGRSRIAARITELSARLKDGLAAMDRVTLRTPISPEMSMGITCFDVTGVSGSQVVSHLAAKGIQISTASYRIPYARIGTSILNTPAEIDEALGAIAELAR